MATAFTVCFNDTIKGGDYRAREANVYRLAEVSGSIIDQCVAQGVPFARDYSGLLDNRSFRRCSGFAYFLCSRSNRTTIASGSLWCFKSSD